MNNVSCSYCGNKFDTVSIEDTYSILVDDCGIAKEIVIGKFVPEALHYCSSNCMFNREEGKLLIV